MIGDERLEIGPSIRETLFYLQSLFTAWSTSPALDAQVLLAEITAENRAWLLAHPEEELTFSQQEMLKTAVTRLQNGEPLPYVIGHWEFYGLDFNINSYTLIPRPETELLVEQAMAWLETHPGVNQVADIGTGSGCIAVTLAHTHSNLHITATDISLAALEVAKSNAVKHQVDHQIQFIHADLFPANLIKYHLICANLPYIPTQTLKGLEVFGKEPTLALDGGPDGLDLIRKLLPDAQKNLASEGLVLLEIENTQGKIALNLARTYFPEAQIALLPDLAGHDRLVRIEKIPL